MTSASTQMITRCPKCGTAFRVTTNQLQSAKGSVRCGSCLNVFKAQEHVVAVKPKTEPSVTPATTLTPDNADDSTPIATDSPADQPAPQPNPPEAFNNQPLIALKKPNFGSTQDTQTAENQVSTHPTPKSIDLDDEDVTLIGDDILISDDTLISDDMEDEPTDGNKYEFDSFMDIDIKPSTDISLFERKMRHENDNVISEADESWAEMLIDEEEGSNPQLGITHLKSDEELADEALIASHQAPSDAEQNSIKAQRLTPPAGLVFSLVDETDNPTVSADEFILNDELTQIPSNQGFKPAITHTTEIPEETVETAAQEDTTSKRQVKTQPKIRAYDGSRAALLMNIIPAPIEFTAKSMRRWYQRKLWATLSLLALVALAAQIAWFKFDALSRIEPYRTAYLFACPYLGCELPTLVDVGQITTSNLVVREHPTVENALAVDVMIINSAPFDQPFPDLVLVFSDIDDNLVASRRFTPKDYLGGELIGRDLMPQNQKVYITLDIVDPGTEAVNYRIYIPHQ